MGIPSSSNVSSYVYADSSLPPRELSRDSLLLSKDDIDCVIKGCKRLAIHKKDGKRYCTEHYGGK